LAIHHIAVDLPAIPGTIVPAATVARMLALLRGFSGDVTVSVYEARISFATERWTLTSKVIDGTFPNYSHLLLPRRKHPLVVDRAALVRAVRLVDGVTQDPVKPRGIILAATVEELEVASAADAACAASVSLPLSDQGEVARVGVKASYLLDALAGLSTPLVELHITTEPPWAPVWVRAPDSADGVAIMPVKI
jgi:DNA polymerase-3 subunit beta